METGPGDRAAAATCTLLVTQSQCHIHLPGRFRCIPYPKSNSSSALQGYAQDDRGVWQTSFRLLNSRLPAKQKDCIQKVFRHTGMKQLDCQSVFTGKQNKTMKRETTDVNLYCLGLKKDRKRKGDAGAVLRWREMIDENCQQAKWQIWVLHPSFTSWSPWMRASDNTE